jgi:hypothetical protein
MFIEEFDPLYSPGGWSMRVILKSVLTFVVLALVVGPAVAEEIRAMMMKGVSNEAALLMWPSVQSDLKLTDEQIAKLSKLQSKYNAELKEIQPLPRLQRGEKTSEIVKFYTDAADKAVRKALKPDQVKRLRQIDMQMRHLGDKDVQKKLKLNPKQLEKLTKIDDYADKEMGEIYQSKDDDAVVFLKMETVQVDARERAWNLLTDTQKKEWKKLSGEEFPFK